MTSQRHESSGIIVLVPVFLFLLFCLIQVGRTGYSYGFHLGGIWGGILGIVIGVLLGIIEGIGLIAVIASPFMVISKVKRVLRRSRDTSEHALEQPCSESRDAGNNESNMKWGPCQCTISELGIVVSVFSFFGVFLGCIIGTEVSHGFHPDSILKGIFWLIVWPFLGGFMGLMVGFVFVLGLWVLMKILNIPYSIVSRIIQYVRSKRSFSVVSALFVRSRQWLQSIRGLLSGLSFLLFLLFILMLGCLGGYTSGFELGGVWGGILGIVITPLLAVIGGIALIALVGSPFWIVPKVRWGLERFSSTIRRALGRPCPVSSSVKCNESDRELESSDDVDMNLALLVSLLSFYGVLGGYMWGVDCGPQQENGWNVTFWIINGAFLGGFIGLVTGFLLIPAIWVLVKIIRLPRWVVSRIIRYVRSKKSCSF